MTTRRLVLSMLLGLAMGLLVARPASAQYATSTIEQLIQRIAVALEHPPQQVCRCECGP